MSNTARNARRLLGLALAAALLAVALVACGGTPTAIPATPSPTPPAAASGAGRATAPAARAQPTTAPVAPASSAPPPAASDAPGGETGGGDEPTVRYSDPAGTYHFQHPQSWGQTTQPGDGVRFTGRDEFISVTIVTTALGPLDYAKADAGALATASPGFQGKAPVAYNVAGQTGAVVAYTWQAGPSSVTGKAVPSAAKRYYIPGPGGKGAVFTYSSPTQSYDPAGADDFATAFAWGK